MNRLGPLLVPCRACKMGPGDSCVTKTADGSYGMTPREPHAIRHRDAGRASEMLDERVGEGEMESAMEGRS